jgi:hypothetical protein
MKNLYTLIFKNLKLTISIFIIGFVFSGCSPLLTGSSPEPYSKEQTLNNESLIIFSASRDKYVKDKKISLRDRIDLAVENIGTKEVYAFGNNICNEQLHWLFEARPNFIDTDNICGNVYIAKLPFGNYKINTIYIRTFNINGQLQQILEYKIIDNNTFSLNSTNEALYIGNTHYKPLIVSRQGQIYSLELTVSDNFDNDIEILKSNDLIHKDLNFIDKSLNIPTTLIKKKTMWD